MADAARRTREATQARRWPRRSATASRHRATLEAATVASASSGTAKGNARRRMAKRSPRGGVSTDSRFTSATRARPGRADAAGEPVRVLEVLRRPRLPLGEGGDRRRAHGDDDPRRAARQVLAERRLDRGRLPGDEADVELGAGLELEPRDLPQLDREVVPTEAAAARLHDPVHATAVGVPADAEIGQLGGLGVGGDEAVEALRRQRERVVPGLRVHAGRARAVVEAVAVLDPHPLDAAAGGDLEVERLGHGGPGQPLHLGPQVGVLDDAAIARSPAQHDEAVVGEAEEAVDGADQHRVGGEGLGRAVVGSAGEVERVAGQYDECRPLDAVEQAGELAGGGLADRIGQRPEQEVADDEDPPAGRHRHDVAGGPPHGDARAPHGPVSSRWGLRTPGAVARGRPRPNTVARGRAPRQALPTTRRGNPWPGGGSPALLAPCW